LRGEHSQSIYSIAENGLAQVLGLLAAPGAFFVLVFKPLDLIGWDLVAVRSFFVMLSMLAMGLLVVIQWDALYPDRRDYLVLTPLPVHPATLFAAKLAALGLYLGGFLVAINATGALFWPAIDSSAGVLWLFGAHLAAVLAGGLFMALAAAAVQGILRLCLRGRLLRQVTLTVQTLLLAAHVTMIFLIPLAGVSLHRLTDTRSPLLDWYPGFWFAGLYEWMRPATQSSDLRALGTKALEALAWAAALFAVTYVPGYWSHARRALNTPERPSSGPGILRRAWTSCLNRFVLDSPTERAVFHFISATIVRSAKHRMFLAVYGGFGLAVAIMSVAPASGGSIHLPRGGVMQAPFVLSFVLVSGLRAAFNMPSELRANWAFRMAGVNALRDVMTATRKWIFLCGLVPLFALFAAIESLYAPWMDVYFHALFGLAASALLMETMFLGFNKTPFTCSYLPGRINVTGHAAIYIAGFTFYSRVMAAAESALGQSPIAAALAFSLLSGAAAFLGRWQVSRTEAGAIPRYEDTGNAAVEPLSLLGE